MAKNTTVSGIYPYNREALEQSVVDLKTSGFRNTAISILYPENPGNKDWTHEKNGKPSEDIAAGVGTGAVLGEALGWLAGVGVLATPGVGFLSSAGPILAALAGVGVGSSVGGLSAAMIGAGIPEYEAKRYERQIKSGGLLLSVQCCDSRWAKLAKAVLERTGAEDISSTREVSRVHAASDKPGRRRIVKNR